jgi:hypothetical protein
MVALISSVVLFGNFAIAILKYLSERSRRKEAEMNIMRLTNCISIFNCAIDDSMVSKEIKLIEKLFPGISKTPIHWKARKNIEKRIVYAIDAMNLQAKRADEFLTKSGK